MTTFDLLLIGNGNVAKRFVSLLEEQRAALARRYQLRTRIIGIATRRTGGQYVASAFPPPLRAMMTELRRDRAEAQSAKAGRRTSSPGMSG